MNIQPITPDSPGCYGVCCPDHAICTRYHLVNGASASLPVQGTCDHYGNGERPHFIKIKESA